MGAGEEHDGAHTVDERPTPRVRHVDIEAGEELPVGAHVGRFQILETVGEGGMGRVYAAYDPELDRRVAIKLISGSQRSRQSDLRLLREAQAMARLSHPNVVSVYDVGTFRDRFVFLAMELVEGQTLGEWMREEERDWPQVVEMMMGAGRGLTAAHDAGLVHRDFKPSNVLIDNDGRARVTDFGIARLDEELDESADGEAEHHHVTPLTLSVTRTGSTLGTPLYMAPEQHQGEPADARADQWSFCVTLFEGLFGVRPFEGNEAEVAVAVTSGARREPPPHDVPAWVLHIVDRGLSRAPADRFPSMSALLAALARDPRARRRRMMVVLGAALLGAAAAGGVFYAARSSPPAAAAEQCSFGAQKLVGVWDASTRANLARAFTNSKAVFAPAAIESVGKTFDGYARALTSGYAGACNAHARGEHSATLYDRQIMCLDRRRFQLRSLVELMSGDAVDGQMVRKAPTAAQSLSPVEHCNDTKTLLATRPLPNQPDKRAAAREVVEKLDRAHTHGIAGRHKSAFALAKEAREIATKAEWPGGAARALQAIAAGQLAAGKVEEARKTMELAADELAAVADHLLYAKVRLQILALAGAVMQERDRVPALRRSAEHAVLLAGNSLELRAELEMTVGNAAIQTGDRATALTYVRRAINSFTELNGSDSYRLAAPYNTLGVIYKGEEKWDEALQAFNRAIEITEKAIGPNHPKVGRTLMNMSGVELGRGNHDASETYGKRSLAIVAKTYGEKHPAVGAALLNMALPIWALGRFERAFELTHRALKIWEPTLGEKHPHVGIALMNLGGIRKDQRRCKEALPFLERARVAFASQRGSGTDLINDGFIGTCYMETGRIREALRVLEKSVAAYQKRKHDALGHKATTMFALARTLRAAKRSPARARKLAVQARVGMVHAKLTSDIAYLDKWLAGKAN